MNVFLNHCLLELFCFLRENSGSFSENCGFSIRENAHLSLKKPYKVIVKDPFSLGKYLQSYLLEIWVSVSKKIKLLNK